MCPPSFDAYASRFTQDSVLGHFQPSLSGLNLSFTYLPRTTPDFLHAALDRSAYAAFFTESRTRLLDSTSYTGNPGPSWATLSRPSGTFLFPSECIGDPRCRLISVLLAMRK